MARLPSLSHSASRPLVRFPSSKRMFSSLEADIKSLPWQYLRAMDSSNYDASTHQRTDVPIEKGTGKPLLLDNTPTHHSIKSVAMDGDDYQITWSDNLSSRYNVAWVQRQLARLREESPEERVLWSNLTENDVRDSSDLSISFSDLLTNDDAKKTKTLRALYQYGILLVTDTPIDDNGAGVAALGAALGGGSEKKIAATSILANYKAGGSEIILPNGTDGPLRTLYGTVWSTSSAEQTAGSSVSDSAYSQDCLPLHTDMTYLRDPPGLQIFTMVHPATQGGESVFADGFAVADELRAIDQDSFQILSETVRRYRCLDNSLGWHLEATGRVIEVERGQIVGIRHNDLDRLPDLPSVDVSAANHRVDDFYERLRQAHSELDKLLAKDKFRLVMKLQPGDTMVVANQRCLHGRCSFESTTAAPRSVTGCYVR
jgi:alpha-ketoglutarate-dependent taurine dioxygenase